MSVVVVVVVALKEVRRFLLLSHRVAWHRHYFYNVRILFKQLLHRHEQWRSWMLP
jgi:hypothetical protein